MYQWCELCDYWGLHKPGVGKCKNCSKSDDNSTSNPNSNDPQAHLSLCFEKIGTGFLTRQELTESILREVGNIEHTPVEWKSPLSVVNATRAMMADIGVCRQTSTSQGSILVDSCATLNINSNENDLLNFVQVDRNVMIQGTA